MVGEKMSSIPATQNTMSTLIKSTAMIHLPISLLRGCNAMARKDFIKEKTTVLVISFQKISQLKLRD
jgi:hypothetical protein